MFRYTVSRGLLAAALSILPAVSLAEIVVSDSFVRTSRPGAPTGAAFMHIKNTGGESDRLLKATSDIAARVELHTHFDAGDGVMQMIEVEEGFEIAPGATYMLKRGGAHVMFMGLNQTLDQGSKITVTLIFEKAGAIELTIPVDNERQPEHGHKH